MKRRDFLKTSAVAAGLAGSLEVLRPLTASEGSSPTPSSAGATQADNRSTEYLRRGRADKYLPKPPAAARAYPISPMPLAERIKRKIVPQRGFCSIAPGSLVSESLTIGNGAMNIELMGDPYAEQILFHHESLLLPWKRPLEASKVADIFPQVRQMVMDGKYREAIEFAFAEMEKGPIKLNTWPHPTVP